MIANADIIDESMKLSTINKDSTELSLYDIFLSIKKLNDQVTKIEEDNKRLKERIVELENAYRHLNRLKMEDKEKLLKELSEIIPDNADVTYCTITWWDDTGCHNAEMDNPNKEWVID